MRSPFLFRLFLFRKLPAAWLAGIRLEELTDEKCVVSVPYKWLTQNPFRSIYFACLQMAGEMSTGLLAYAHVYESLPRISMLVINMKSEFFKKADERIYFTCMDGKKIQETVISAKQSGDAHAIEVITTGRTKSGIEVARFVINWSFKRK